MKNRLQHAVQWSHAREKERRKTSFVYLVRSGDFYKIGIADNPAERLAQMQTGNPAKLVLVRAWPSHQAQREERLIHSLLQRYHHAGEWFKLPVELVAFVTGK